jgi:hypothetical protein
MLEDRCQMPDAGKYTRSVFHRDLASGIRHPF